MQFSSRPVALLSLCLLLLLALFGLMVFQPLPWKELHAVGYLAIGALLMAAASQTRQLFRNLASIDSPASEPATSTEVTPEFEDHIDHDSDHARTYLDQAHSLVLVLDTEGKVVYLNQHGYQLLGYPLDSLLHSNWLKLCVPSEHHASIITTFKEYRQSRSLAPMYTEHPLLTAMGEQRLIAWNCTPIELNGQQQLLCSGLDITDSRATQDKLHKLSCAVEQGTSSVMIFDRRGRIEYINPAFSEQTGYQAVEVLGKKPRFLEAEETCKTTLMQLRRALTRGEDWHGDICYRKKGGQRFWVRERISPIKNDQQQISHYVSITEDITIERKQQAKIEQLAYNDQLTQLPNRRAFLQQLNEAIKNCRQDGRSLTLFHLNLDHFKHINDSLGHSAGDRFLCRIAEKFRHEICREDLIARQGSDEFLLALHDINQDQANDFARRLNRLIRQPLLAGDRGNPHRDMMMTASIGIARVPEDSLNANELIKFSSLAMQQVKQQGRNGHLLFTSKLLQNLEADLYLEKELQQAIQNDDFVLYFQPQIDVKQRCVIGMEALVRWIHPERGMVPPDQFIAIAERSGLIIALGQHVLRKACETYQRLDTLGWGQLRIAINLSALQFRDPLFSRTFKQVLTEMHVPAAHIELELTESMLMTNIEESIDILSQLKQLGATLAIDDFGTGYSSLSYLKRLPVDIIKVDRSFVKDIPEDSSDMEITAAVIAMAHKLKREVVAEGVETEAQQQFLHDNHCNYLQGYLFSPPVAETELLSTIEQINQQLHQPQDNCVQLEFD